MPEQQWPDEARDAVGDVLEALDGSDYTVTANAVLAALAPHVAPRADEWEWGVRWPKSVQHVDSEADARESVAESPSMRTVVRRRAGVAPGPWEVAPDA